MNDALRNRAYSAESSVQNLVANISEPFRIATDL